MQEERESVRKTAPQETIERVAKVFNVTTEDLTGRSRTQDIVEPRQIAYYILKIKGGMTLDAIAKLFGRDRSTIIAGINVIRRRVERDGSLKELTEVIDRPSAKRSDQDFTHKEVIEIGEILGIDWNQYSITEFRLGLNTELEHGSQGIDITQNDPVVLGKIVLVHLRQVPCYYTCLRRMIALANQQ